MVRFCRLSNMLSDLVRSFSHHRIIILATTSKISALESCLYSARGAAVFSNRIRIPVLNQVIVTLRSCYYSVESRTKFLATEGKKILLFCTLSAKNRILSTRCGKLCFAHWMRKIVFYALTYVRKTVFYARSAENSVENYLLRAILSAKNHVLHTNYWKSCFMHSLWKIVFYHRLTYVIDGHSPFIN